MQERTHNAVDRVLECVLILLMALIAALFLGMMIEPLWAAPAPPARPKKVAAVAPVERLAWGDLTGDWRMSWCGGEWELTLSPSGAYRATSGACEWVGNWWIDFEGRLAVAESLLDENGLPGSPSEWAIKWDRRGGKIDPGKLAGDIVWPSGDEGGRFSLRRKR